MTVLDNAPLFAMFFLACTAAVLSCFKNRLFTIAILSIFSLLYLAYSSGRIGGVDTPFYRAAFGTPERCEIFEFAFRHFCSIDSPAGFSFLFLGSSVLLLFAIYHSCPNYQILSLTILILFPLYFIVVDLGYLRQSIATSIVLIFFFNQGNLKLRLIGSILGPLFHLSSFFLVFFLEIINYKSNLSRFALFLAPVLAFTGISMFNKFNEAGLISLFAKGFSFLSLLQVALLLTLAHITSAQLRWNNYIKLLVSILCILSYFGHLYRIFLFLMPILSIGVASYLAGIKLSHRLLAIGFFVVFGFVKLNASLAEFDGAFDIPYSANAIFWFFDI
jgi:hypothetical protein